MKLFFTSILGKLILTVIAILLTLLAIQTCRVSWGQTREIKLSEALRTSEANLAITQKSTKATTTATTTQKAAQAVARKEAAIATKKLDIALEAAPDWAAERIPSDIADSLREPNSN